MVTPPWLPASIGAAQRRGTATEVDLLSGEALKRMLEGIERAGALVRSERAPRCSVDQAAGYRHILVLMALAVDEALRRADPYDPHISPANVDGVLKWGMDCPDAAYSGSAIRGDAAYRVHGHRGAARYVGLQVMAGMAATANVVLDDSTCDGEGNFEIVLSADPHPGNWVGLPEEATSLVVRQFFYDWVNEAPARIQIECISPGSARRSSSDAGTSSAASVARQLDAIGDFVEASVAFWLDVEEQGRAQGVNVFRDPVNKTEMGGAAESLTVWGSWELAAGEALVIEVVPPEALYWSVALGNHWWETIDYANHQSSLNGFQSVLDEDGVFRGVVAHEDPGVANWLDTAGHRQGPAIFRWVRAAAAPVPRTTLVRADELMEILPLTTTKVDPATRRAAIAARRDGVRRRFAR